MAESSVEAGELGVKILNYKQKLIVDDNQRKEEEFAQATDIVKDLVAFKNGIFSIPKKSLTKITIKTIVDSLIVAPSLLGRTIVNTSGFVFFNMLGNPLNQASFGVFEGFTYIFFYAVLTALFDKFSIDMSKAYGEKDYKLIKNIFSKSLVICLLLIIFLAIPLMWFSSPILQAIAIKADIADNVQYLARISMPMAMIVAINEVFKGFCLSQGWEKPFGYILMVTIPPAIVSNYFLMVKYKMHVNGFVITKTIQELIILTVSIVVFFKTDKNTRGLCSLQETMNDFMRFSWDAIKYMIGIYVECLAIEMAGYFIALVGNTAEIAAYYCIVNIMGMTFWIGFAFAIICRTRMNILIGLGEHKAAKRYFLFVVWVSTFCGLIWTLALYIGKEGLVRIYSDSTEELRYWFDQLIFSYVLFAFALVSIPTAMVGLKSVGGINTLLLLDLIFPLSLHFIGCLIMYLMGYHCNSQQAQYLVINIFMVIACTFFALERDWSQLSSGKEIAIKAIESASHKGASMIRQ